jgi:hypothetical protein
MNRHNKELIQDGMFGGLKPQGFKIYCGANPEVPSGKVRGRPNACFKSGLRSGFVAGIQAGRKEGNLEGIAKGTRIGAAIKKRKVEKAGLPSTLKPSDITPNVRSDFLRPFIAELNKQNLYEPIFKRLIRRGELEGPYRGYGKSSLDERKAILLAYFRTTGKSKFVLKP